jgi:hypothetical protein
VVVLRQEQLLLRFHALDLAKVPTGRERKKTQVRM